MRLETYIYENMESDARRFRPESFTGNSDFVTDEINHRARRVMKSA